MQKISYTNIKEMIINQDERLKDELPGYFNEKISDYLKNKTDVKDINLEGILGFKSENLENVLKDKLRKIKAQYPDDDFQKTFQRLHEEENSWWQAFLRFVSRVFLLNEQEKLLSEILDDLPKEMSKTLEEGIQAEKKKIIKELSSDGVITGLTEKESAAPLGKSVHEVKEYRDDDRKLFFIKDVTFGFKGIMYRIFTGIGNEGIREAIGGAFYHAMGLNNSAEVGIIKDTRNKAVKIFSKAVGEQDDKICSLGQLLKEWDFDQREKNEQAKIENPQDWLNNNQELKKQIMKAHAVSMLIGNRDLKDDNIMIIKKLDGSLQCAPIDFGLSCHKVSTLRWAKNKHMHFDTNNMRHEDSLKLFQSG